VFSSECADIKINLPILLSEAPTIRKLHVPPVPDKGFSTHDAKYTA
jgi:hypothetical protein